MKRTPLMRTAFLPQLALVGLLSACPSQPVANPGPTPTAMPTAQLAPSATPDATPLPTSPQPGPTASAPTDLQPTPSIPPQNGNGPSVATAVGLRLVAASRSLKTTGATVQVVAELLDARGQVIANPPALLWTSSEPATLSVNGTGLVTALRTRGTGDISVSLPGTQLRASLTMTIVASSSGGGGGGGGGGGSNPTPPEITALTVSSLNVMGAGVPVQLSATATPGVSYTWSCLSLNCSDFETTTGATVLWRTPLTPGVYTLQLSVSRDGLTTSETRDITVATGTAEVDVNTDVSQD